MIKEYNFPIIFQNVVGEVIPSHILQKRERFNLDTPIPQDAPSITTSSNHCSQLSNRKFLKIKSKKKEILRRSKITKTMNPFTYRPMPQAQNTNCDPNTPKYINFLKKKMMSSDSGNQERSPNINQADPVKQLSSLQSYEIENDAELRKNHFRIRTSLDRASIERSISNSKQIDQIFSQIPDSFPQTKCKRKETEEDEKMEEADQYKHDQLENDGFNGKIVRPVTKKATKFFERGGNQLKKKTVNFTVQENESVHDVNEATTEQIKVGNNRFKKISEMSGVNSSNRSKLTKKGTQHSHQSYKSKESQWTNKSVVSIKFIQNESGDVKEKSKTSLRSNESILNEGNMWVKNTARKKTGTYKHILESKDMLSEKKYKSDHKIKTELLDFKPVVLSKSKISSKNVVSLKSVKSISKKTIKDTSKNKKKVLKSRVSIFRNIENGVFNEICENSIAASLKDPNFNDGLFKRSNTGLPKTMKTYTQQRDVYDQLNNFHKFLNERETMESQRELVRTIAKPIVIQNEINIRVRRGNQNIRNQNLIIEMGLNLVRRMNRLAQKKL